MRARSGAPQPIALSGRLGVPEVARRLSRVRLLRAKKRIGMVQQEHPGRHTPPQVLFRSTLKDKMLSNANRAAVAAGPR